MTKHSSGDNAQPPSAPDAGSTSSPAPPAPPQPPASPSPLEPREGQAFAGLLGLIRRLRAPDGCPWDREQTLRTLTPYIIEEAYEVIDAIEHDDSAHLKEELGDLIFLLFFCAEIGRAEERFTIDDLLDRHREKMIARHPHVFGDAARLGTGAAAQQWEELKQEEGRGRRSVVDGRLSVLPALTGAYRVQEKAAAVGFDWEDTRGVLDKIEEEIAELRAELEKTVATDSHASKEAGGELGDLFFALVNLARKLKIDPEAALRGTTARFIERFRAIEERLAESGKRPSQVSLAELDRLWEEAKTREPHPGGPPAGAPPPTPSS